MLAVPRAIPVMTPVELPTVATLVLLLVQIPPAEVLVNVVVELWQTATAPAIGAGVPATDTVNVLLQPVGNV